MMGLRGGAVVAAVCLAVAGCSSSTTEQPPSTSTSTSAAASSLDLSRLADFNRQLPPDFVASAGEVRPTKPQYVDRLGDMVSFAGPVTVDPPQCLPLLRPVAGEVGAASIGLRGDGPDKQGISVRAVDPVTVPVEIPKTGCDRMTFHVKDAAVPTDGTVERIEAPTIDGATVIALKVSYDQFPRVDYAYAAILDGHALVSVQAALNADYQAQPLLPDLLVKAVAVLRGQGQQPPPPPTKYDVARIVDLDPALPQGFAPVPNLTTPFKIGRELAETTGGFISYGKPLDVDPPSCSMLLKPITAQLGADAMRIRGDAPEYRSISVGAVAPVAVPAELPTSGCDRFTYQVLDERYPSSGSAERLTAPAIDGATTFALRITVEGSPDPEYSYVAIVGNDVYVDVQARVAPDFPAESTLPELLTHAVAAIRKE